MQRSLAQPTFTDHLVSDLGSPKAKEFLRTCNRLIDFDKLAEPLTGMYGDDARGGAPHWPVTLMLRVLFLQKAFALSDPQAEQQILDRLSFRQFLGLSLSDKTPDHTTLWRFRERMNRSGQIADLFDRVLADLKDRGLLLQAGTIIDATLIEAPRPRKKPDGQKTPADPCASYTRKNGQIHFGYRAHVAADRNGFITDYVFDTAKESEHTHFDALAADETHAVFADSGCRSKERVAALEARGVWAMICHRRARGQAELTDAQKRFNRVVGPVRAFVEHPFARIKAMLGPMRRARYTGIRRNALDFALSAAMTNLLRSLDELRKRPAQPPATVPSAA